MYRLSLNKNILQVYARASFESKEEKLVLTSQVSDEEIVEHRFYDKGVLLRYGNQPGELYNVLASLKCPFANSFPYIKAREHLCSLFEIIFMRDLNTIHFYWKESDGSKTPVGSILIQNKSEKDTLEVDLSLVTSKLKVVHFENFKEGKEVEEKLKAHAMKKRVNIFTVIPVKKDSSTAAASAKVGNPTIASVPAKHIQASASVAGSSYQPG